MTVFKQLTETAEPPAETVDTVSKKSRPVDDSNTDGKLDDICKKLRVRFGDKEISLAEVTSDTTCYDVIYSILYAEQTDSAETRWDAKRSIDIHAFGLFETRDDGVARRLDGTTRIETLVGSTASTPLLVDLRRMDACFGGSRRSRKSRPRRGVTGDARNAANAALRSRNATADVCSSKHLHSRSPPDHGNGAENRDSSSHKAKSSHDYKTLEYESGGPMRTILDGQRHQRTDIVDKIRNQQRHLSELTKRLGQVNVEIEQFEQENYLTPADLTLVDREAKLAAIGDYTTLIRNIDSQIASFDCDAAFLEHELAVELRKSPHFEHLHADIERKHVSLAESVTASRHIERDLSEVALQIGAKQRRIVQLERRLIELDKEERLVLLRSRRGNVVLGRHIQRHSPDRSALPPIPDYLRQRFRSDEEPIYFNHIPQSFSTSSIAERRAELAEDRLAARQKRVHFVASTENIVIPDDDSDTGLSSLHSDEASLLETLV